MHTLPTNPTNNSLLSVHPTLQNGVLFLNITKFTTCCWLGPSMACLITNRVRWHEKPLETRFLPIPPISPSTPSSLPSPSRNFQQCDPSCLVLAVLPICNIPFHPPWEDTYNNILGLCSRIIYPRGRSCPAPPSPLLLHNA